MRFRLGIEHWLPNWNVFDSLAEGYEALGEKLRTEASCVSWNDTCMTRRRGVVSSACGILPVGKNVLQDFGNPVASGSC